MYHFYVEGGDITQEQILIRGDDVKHIKNVLRMKLGDRLILCDGSGTDYYCQLTAFGERTLTAQIEKRVETEAELNTRLVLFQGIPKRDKMELIIQKAVELGVNEIVPMRTKRVEPHVRDAAKEEKRLARWQAIAEAAAKQSGRGVLPRIASVCDFSEALARASALACALIPYENAEDMLYTRAVMQEAAAAASVGILIGPEGGFEAEEIEVATAAGLKPVTLGRRILRTETAGLCALSILMYEAEVATVLQKNRSESEPH